jgi:urea transport system permease protein
MLGGLFIGTTLLMPRGIIGTYNYWRSNQAEKKFAATDSSMPVVSPHAAE